jgi:hypothetical protein
MAGRSAAALLPLRHTGAVSRNANAKMPAAMPDKTTFHDER